MIRLFTIFLFIFQALFKSKSDLLLENMPLRQQIGKGFKKAEIHLKRVPN